MNSIPGSPTNPPRRRRSLLTDATLVLLLAIAAFGATIHCLQSGLVATSRTLAGVKPSPDVAARGDVHSRALHPSLAMRKQTVHKPAQTQT